MKYLDDSELVKFLQTYKPVAPKEADHFEENLFHLLKKEPQLVRRKSVGKFILPGAIAAGVVLMFGGAYFLRPSSEVAENQMEMEEFLVNSWQHTVEGTYINHEQTPEGQWLILTNVEKK